ncbi:MAG: phage holin family protein [Fimbriimonadaceae bacterium]|nr:phage holin family protein [Fimbriimonadaceae bacterium]
MKNLLIRWIVMVLALMVAAWATGLVFPGGFVTKAGSAGEVVILFVSVVVLAGVNAVLGGLLKLMFLPLNCLTLGLFSLVINALVFWLVGSLGLGFQVEGFLPALVGSLLYSAANGVLGIFVPDEKGSSRKG